MYPRTSIPVVVGAGVSPYLVYLRDGLHTAQLRFSGSVNTLLGPAHIVLDSVLFLVVANGSQLHKQQPS